MRVRLSILVVMLTLLPTSLKQALISAFTGLSVIAEGELGAWGCR